MQNPETGYLRVKKLLKPIFVIQMGWRRWGNDTKVHWLNELRVACIETVEDINDELQRIEDEST